MAFHALNGTVVGLCIDNTKYAVHNAASPDAYLYPEFILNHVPLCECVATGKLHINKSNNNKQNNESRK
jgi:hypothetical protein